MDVGAVEFCAIGGQKGTFAILLDATQKTQTTQKGGVRWRPFNGAGEFKAQGRNAANDGSEKRYSDRIGKKIK